MFVVRKQFLVLGNGTSAWVPYEGIKAAKLEMRCKTRIVLGDEYPVMGYPTEQRQMRHEAYTLTEGQC